MKMEMVRDVEHLTGTAFIYAKESVQSVKDTSHLTTLPIYVCNCTSREQTFYLHL